MKKLFIFLLCICSNYILFAQKEYFIYLQSANDKPFYLKMKDKIHSSTASGYLILSNLADSTYTFSIGQAGSSSLTESKYIVKLNSKDKGFLLKEFQTGLGLFDLQNLTVTMPVALSTSGQTINALVKKDPFSTLLSQAASDSSLLIASAPVTTISMERNVKEEKVKADNESGKIVSEKSVNVSEPSENDNVSKQHLNAPSENKINTKSDIELTVSNNNKTSGDLKVHETMVSADEPFFKRSTVMKRSESSTTEGFGLVYLDNINGNVDTVRIIIPAQKSFNQTAESANVNSDKRFLDIGNNGNEEKEKTVLTTQKLTCKNIANDNDFYKVRKNMATADSEDEMIIEAKKHFSKRCYTTLQIRSLSALFINVENKYNFLVQAYQHVSDRENFGTLEKELANSEMKNRFKKFIEN